MRALLGILILGGLFLAAAAWQRGHTETLRAQRRAEFGLPEDPQDARSVNDWSLLVLGRPSGAAPLPLPEEQVERDPGGGDGGASEPAPPALTPDYAYTVQQGDVLGRVCQRHYGTAKPALVEAVARYNRLSSPDAIRAGDPILLPDRALLGH